MPTTCLHFHTTSYLGDQLVRPIPSTTPEDTIQKSTPFFNKANINDSRPMVQREHKQLYFCTLQDIDLTCAPPFNQIPTKFFSICIQNMNLVNSTTHHDVNKTPNAIDTI